MLKCFRYICFMGFLLIFPVGVIKESYNVIMISVAGLFFNNVIYALEKLSERVIFLFFHITFFTFILSRPFIDTMTNKKWWIVTEVSDARFAILAIVLSLLFLFLGAFLASKLKRDKVIVKRSKNFNEKRMPLLQNISLILFAIAYVFVVVQQIEKLEFMRGREYLEFYKFFHSSLPGFVHTLASFMKYGLCIFLATLPSKKKSFVPLMLFWSSAIPDLIIGIRNPIMLNSLFIIVYYCFRNHNDQGSKWLGKLEKTSLVIMIPIVLAFMGAYSQIRAGGKVVVTNILKMVVNFFYGQGVTFDVLMMGYRVIPRLPHHGPGVYTFSGIIDYVLYGTVGQYVFGTSPLPSGNNLVNAKISHNFSHNMSYLSLNEEYLAGKGWGSSYLLETYADFGILGIIIFSFVLGGILICGMKIMKWNFWFRLFMLNSLLTIFFIPRAEATGWLNFSVTIQFWICTIFCYLASNLCVKKYNMTEEKKCLKNLE